MPKFQGRKDKGSSRGRERKDRHREKHRHRHRQRHSSSEGSEDGRDARAQGRPLKKEDKGDISSEDVSSCQLGEGRVNLWGGKPYFIF